MRPGPSDGAGGPGVRRRRGQPAGAQGRELRRAKRGCHGHAVASDRVLPFDLVFPDLAGREAVAVHPLDEHARPIGTLVFREFYCNDPGCDCRRVVLHAVWVEKRRIVAGIGYVFEPARPPFDDEPQIMLDPLPNNRPTMPRGPTG